MSSLNFVRILEKSPEFRIGQGGTTCLRGLVRHSTDTFTILVICFRIN